VMDLSLQPMPGDSLPAGLTAVFSSLDPVEENAVLVGNAVANLTIETTTATPPGRFPLAVVAHDISCTAIDTVTVVVNGIGPDLDPVADQSLRCGDQNVPLSSSDPEGDPLTLSNNGFPAFATLVDNGNGSGSVQIDAAGSDRGTYSGLTVTSTDSFGFYDSEVFQVDITDTAPVMAPVGDWSLTCLGGVIPVSASDDDDDPLQLSLLGSAPMTSLVDNQDGTGSITVGIGIASGAYELEAVATDQICDGTASDSFTLTIQPNALPLGTPIAPLEVTAGETLVVSAGFTDPEGGLLALSAPDRPAFASLDPVGNGVSDLTLTPGVLEVGVFTFDIVAMDECGGSSLIPVEVTVVPANTPPAADAGPDQTVNEGTDPVVLNGTGSSDDDDDPLAYSWQQIAGPTVLLSDPTAAQPTFAAPFVSDNTTLTFELVVHDGQKSSVADTVDVTVVNFNNPPIADAGDDATIKEGAVATLDGSNSYDPEGDTPLNYLWTQIAGPTVTLQPDDMAAAPTFTAPIGVGTVLEFELVVDDGKEVGDPDTVKLTVVENSPPVADAGASQTKDEGSLVTLDGSGSSDPDGGDTLSYEWVQVGGPTVVLSDDTAAQPTFSAPAVPPGGAVFEFALIVTDDDPFNPKSSTQVTTTVSVTNVNDPPRCDLGRSACPESKLKNVDECLMWPPNHKMVSVGITGVMDEDAEFNDVTIKITGVTQDEPVNGQGDGDSSPDAVIQLSDPADSVLVRSERMGLGGAQENGRVYVVNFTADDGFESCNGSVKVGVPHDRKDIPVDDGQLFDSTQP